MPAIMIDYEKCSGDGLCAAVCPVLLFTMQDRYPVLEESAAQRCLACGHCVAVCPTGAVGLENMTAADCRKLDRTLQPDPSAVDQLLMSRRSVRAYKPEPLGREELAELLTVANHAPSAVNRHPVRWIVLQQPAEVQRVAAMTVEWLDQVTSGKETNVRAEYLRFFVEQWQAGDDVICRGAPNLILAHGVSGLPHMAQDVSIALTYLEIAIAARGLGSCWAGLVTSAANAYPPLREFLGFPEDHEVYGGLMLGRPQFRYQRIPTRTEAVIDWR